MTIKRILLLSLTAIISITCVGIMNIHYDVLSRYTYKISESDAEKLRNNLSYKEIDYIIDYAISADLFIDYVDTEGFNIYHFPFYNRINDLVGEFVSKANIVYYAEKTLKENLNEDDVINFIGMGYQLESVAGFYDQNDSLFRKFNLAVDPLNYDYEFKNNDTVYNLVPYDLVKIEYLANNSDRYLRSRVAEKLKFALEEVEKDANFKVFNNVIITRAFESYDQVNYLRKTGDKYLTAGRNYYQLGRMFTLYVSDRYNDAFFAKFDEIIAKYGFVKTNEEINEYLYTGK